MFCYNFIGPEYLRKVVILCQKKKLHYSFL
nr:MAG TPA: hypothetical protein [Caudoviricetes sp.]